VSPGAARQYAVSTQILPQGAKLALSSLKELLNRATKANAASTSTEPNDQRQYQRYVRVFQPWLPEFAATDAVGLI